MSKILHITTNYGATDAPGQHQRDIQEAIERENLGPPYVRTIKQIKHAIHYDFDKGVHIFSTIIELDGAGL